MYMPELWLSQCDIRSYFQTELKKKASFQYTSEEILERKSAFIMCKGYDTCGKLKYMLNFQILFSSSFNQFLKHW